jgi:phospholipid transport system substrate-binding protein
MKSNKTISRWLATVLCLVSGVVLAQVPDQNTPPDVLIKMVVSDVMASVKADPDIQKGNIPKVMELVEKENCPIY